MGGRRQAGLYAVPAGEQDGALAGLRDAVLLGLEVARGDAVRLIAQHLGEHFPQRQDAGHLLQRDEVVRLYQFDSFQRPAQGLQHQLGAWVVAQRPPEARQRLPLSHLPRHLGEHGQQLASLPLPRGRERRARRGANQHRGGAQRPVRTFPSERVRATLADVQLDRVVAVGAPGLAGGAVKLKPDTDPPEGVGRYVPAARTREQVMVVDRHSDTSTPAARIASRSRSSWTT